MATNAITMNVGDTETLDIGSISHLQGCQWTISRPNEVVFVSTPQSYSTRVTIKAVKAFTGSPCIVQCKYYYLELDPTTGRYTYSRSGYKDWNIMVKEGSNSGSGSADDGTVSLSSSEITIKVGSGQHVYASGNYSGKLTWSMDNGNIATFSSTQNNKVWCYGEAEGVTYLRATTANGKQAVCKINVAPKESKPNVGEEYEYVDLGLSVYWASKNLGANKPEDTGSYYAWGETSPKSSFNEYNSSTYGYHISNYGSKVEDDENYYSLFSEFDAATKKLGSEWSIPTITQWKELWDKCNFEMIYDSNKQLKGIKAIGVNKNYIYLPVTGAKYLLYSENEGCYWSKYGDIREPYKYALGISFPSRYGIYSFNDCAYFRYMGLPIRPVKKKDVTQVNTIKISKSSESDKYIYDLQGNRVICPQHGKIYIMNGKKVLY